MENNEITSVEDLRTVFEDEDTRTLRKAIKAIPKNNIKGMVSILQHDISIYYQEMQDAKYLRSLLQEVCTHDFQVNFKLLQCSICSKVKNHGK